MLEASVFVMRTIHNVIQSYFYCLLIFSWKGTHNLLLVKEFLVSIIPLAFMLWEIKASVLSPFKLFQPCLILIRQS
jgi:hypothetical protein